MNVGIHLFPELDCKLDAYCLNTTDWMGVIVIEDTTIFVPGKTLEDRLTWIDRLTGTLDSLKVLLVNREDAIDAD